MWTLVSSGQAPGPGSQSRSLDGCLGAGAWPETSVVKKNVRVRGQTEPTVDFCDEQVHCAKHIPHTRIIFLAVFFFFFFCNYLPSSMRIKIILNVAAAFRRKLQRIYDALIVHTRPVYIKKQKKFCFVHKISLVQQQFPVNTLEKERKQ